MRRVFILGCERSGSTWLANIFAAHPEVGFTMEPLSPYAGLLPQWLDRYAGLGSQPAPAGSLTRMLEGLPAAQFPLLYCPGGYAPLFAIDRMIGATCGWLSRQAGRTLVPRAARFVALNLNTQSLPLSRVFLPRAAPAVSVAKELRLNFRANLLAKACPDADYLVILRHPAAQIGSVLRLFEGGRLAELRGSLDGLVPALEAAGQLARYRPAGSQRGLEALDLMTTLALWWVASYDQLLRALAPYRVRVVLHEALSVDPAQQAAALLQHCGLDVADPVARFIQQSSTRAPATGSAVDTDRVSGEVATQIHRLPKALSQQIADALPIVRLADGQGIGPYLHHYFDVKTGVLRDTVQLL